MAAAKDHGLPVTTGSYANPLAPVPGDGTVDSCADPTVIKGQDGETLDGKQVWYMYCTTDPLNDADVDANGDPVFHRIPTMVSTDLVNWTYVGDAFPLDGGDIPAWIDPTAAFWAPEVVYSSATDQYYLFVTVTETTAAGGGSRHLPRRQRHRRRGRGQPHRSVGLRRRAGRPAASRPERRACSYFWTFDPDVLGDTVTDEGILYYGSLLRRHLRHRRELHRDRRDRRDGDTGDDTRIAIGNRYEGANVVQRDGYYYLFASATNCCNGALTGYSVFVGRSTSPFGPFVDREGNSFLEAAVGGTPFLTMNGNRWVGTGHNTVFRRGRAVVDDLPRRRPGGPVLRLRHRVHQAARPARPGRLGERLADRERRAAGRPTRKMPAPAAQEGQRSRYKTKLVKPLVMGRLLESDEFGGTRSEQRLVVGEGRTGDVTVSGGVLRWEVEHTDLYVDSNTASVLVRDAPTRDYVVETKVRLYGLPDEGCCFNYAQAGLVLYGDDDNFIKLTTSRSGRRGRRSSPRSSTRCPRGGAATATPSSARPATTGPTCASSWST